MICHLLGLDGVLAPHQGYYAAGKLEKNWLYKSKNVRRQPHRHALGFQGGWANQHS